MVRKTMAVSLVLFFLMGCSGNEGVFFSGGLQQAQSKANALDKLVLVNFYSPT